MDLSSQRQPGAIDRAARGKEDVTLSIRGEGRLSAEGLGLARRWYWGSDPSFMENG